jgi:hypothetical protein
MSFLYRPPLDTLTKTGYNYDYGNGYDYQNGYGRVGRDKYQNFTGKLFSTNKFLTAQGRKKKRVGKPDTKRRVKHPISVKKIKRSKPKNKVKKKKIVGKQTVSVKKTKRSKPKKKTTSKI